jgi:hypothetical protein
MNTFDEMLKLHKMHLTDEHHEEEAKIVEENNFPFNAKMGMVFTSYKSHIPYIKYALEQYRKIKDMYIVGSYDTWYINPQSKSHDQLPYPDMWYLAHSWVFKHSTWGGHSKRHGWLWDHYYASSVLRPLTNLEYIWTSNGDCCWDRPEGAYEIIDLLGDADLMSGQSEHYQSGEPMIHTCSVVFKRDAYFSFIDHVINKLKVSTSASYSPEALLTEWVLENDIKYKHAPLQPYYQSGQYKGHHDTYCEQGCASTWKDVLGFVNVTAEKTYRCNTRLLPLDKKYFDLRDVEKHWTDLDKKALYKFYTTGDYRHIMLWWDLSPETPRDIRIERKNWTIDHYGKEPIMNKEGIRNG